MSSQLEVWGDHFGSEYNERNRFKSLSDFDDFYIKRYGLSKSAINKEFIGFFPKETSFLEIGSNIGNQLSHLYEMGFLNLNGIEYQQECVDEIVKDKPYINIKQGRAQEIPFQSGAFDVVFTNNVLIHISPKDLDRVFEEMYRVSRQYIWGCEYFSNKIVEVKYRGFSNLMWKGNYASMFIEKFNDLMLVKEKKLQYLKSPDLVDKMYLLKKN